MALLSLPGERGNGELSAFLLLGWGDFDNALDLTTFLLGETAASVDDWEHPIVILNNYIYNVTNLIKPL
jgi:hypothetical protein